MSWCEAGGGAKCQVAERNEKERRKPKRGEVEGNAGYKKVTGSKIERGTVME